jgi:cellulose biosynthesis protein BcsQ
VQIVALTNIKGGVGKTTTAVNFAYLAAAAGQPTLLWDLDPQGAATWLLNGRPNANGSVRKLVQGKRELPELIAATAYERLDLLPADFSYRNFDVHLAERKNPTERLLKMSAALRERYTYLILDCPPGISLLSENVLRAADAVVVPMLPSPLSVRMVATLQEFIAREGWTDLALLPFFSMVDRRRSLHVDVIAQARARFRNVLRTEMPYWSEIERMGVRREPLPAYAPRSDASRLYAELLAEVIAGMGSPEDRSARPDEVGTDRTDGTAERGSAAPLVRPSDDGSALSP